MTCAMKLAKVMAKDYANEAARLGHGYSTYGLVEEGLKTNVADKEPRDDQLGMREWLDYATQRVPQMQQDELDEQKKQGRRLDRVNLPKRIQITT
jgi:hypothetical protein